MTSMGALQIISTDVRIGILHVVGFAVLSGLLALGAAFVYRERTTREIPLGTGVLIGVSLVAIWLNARAILSGSFVGDLAMTDYGTGYYLLGVVVAAVALAEGGRRVGDYLASDVFNIERIDSDSAIASLLKSAGVVVTIELPEEIADLDGYPPVDDAIKRRLAGRTFQFPHRLPEALLVARIEGESNRTSTSARPTSNLTRTGRSNASPSVGRPLAWDRHSRRRRWPLASGLMPGRVPAWVIRSNCGRKPRRGAVLWLKRPFAPLTPT